MKKKTVKLVVRREIVRALATVELTRVGGGNTEEPNLWDTGLKMCTQALVVLPAD